MDLASGNFSQDVFIIADAFRGANDEDTRLVLNAMAAKKTPSSLNDLKFYLVPTAWMVKAWPMLNARPPTSGSSSKSNNNNNNNNNNDDDGNSWRERVGIIQNSALLQWEHAVSSSSDEEGADNNLDKKPKAVSPQKPPPLDSSCPLRRELKHGEDFFLLGPNAWLLVREKFGSDGVDLARPVVHHTADQSTLAIALDDNRSSTNSGTNSNKNSDRLVPIPPVGHFSYANMIAEQEGDSEESFLPQGNQQAPQAAGLKSDVVSDEEGEPNDLFPGRNDEPDDMILSGNSQSHLGVAPAAEPEPVLLLPPSTGTISNSTGDGLYPSVQEMDEDPTNKENDSDDIASGGVIPGAAAAATNTRRRHGSGLGNLGNTCFMNSSIQCLAHTDPLRRYFLSGDYMKDLNKDNPLGTGGDLAVQFAHLLAEMWGTSRGPNGNAFQSSYSSSSAVYPRTFKSTLGKHAEQFMGYDQHDSQELATYLLDALHEDTNRVSKKPYVEKPEQGEDEPDDVAANKAWDLHLKREDSRVLENFMGLVKSRVSCNIEGCGRVSTTFDPIMYMSVPIPGSTERTLRVTFIPLDGQKRKRSMHVTLSKTAKMRKFQEKAVEQLSHAGFSAHGKPFASEDLCLADIWSHEVYGWHNLDDDIDKIRDSDVTYIYELKPKTEIQKLEEQNAEKKASTNETVMIEALEKSERDKRYQLDIASQLKLNHDMWKDKLERYVAVPCTMQLVKIMNPRRGTNAERYDLYQKLDSFLDTCIREVDRAGTKRAREEGDDDVGSSSPMDQSYEPISVHETEEDVPELIELCTLSPFFVDVKSRYDLAILEACTESLRKMILVTSKADKSQHKGGIEIQVICRKSSSGSTHYSTVNDKGFVNPIVMRVPSNMTVYGLRQELAKRFSRCLRLNQPLEQRPQMTKDVPAAPSESDLVPMEGESDPVSEEVQSGVESMNVSTENNAINGKDPALLVLRQIPLSYKKKSSSGFKNSNSKQLGSLEIELAYDPSRPISLASPSDEEEQQLVSDMAGPKGNVFLEWPVELCERVFDEVEFEASDELKDAEEEEAEAACSLKEKKTVTILDCVEKYCEMEQLEETEMWYCSRCKNHVRAWKQCHLYRSPPILIMHLKRFQYSASSHRRDKINTFIDFPLTGFDLTEHIMQWNEGEKPIYDCYAVSNHYGGLGGGHYTAYCLNDDGVWCYYDDSRITTDIDPKDVVTEAAYVVYYRRRDVEVSGLGFLEGLQETANIVQDHLDNREESTTLNGEPESASNPNAAQDMDVDVNTTDAESHASSKTMESHEGIDNHFDNTDNYGGAGEGGNNNVVFGGPLLENSNSGNNNFPLQ